MKTAKLKTVSLARGFRRTPQRDAIIRYLEDHDGHPSAGEIFEAVRNEIPGMSFATVYNTLDALREAGAVREMTVDSRRRRFDPDPTLHHHAICVECGKVEDVHGDVTVLPANGDFSEYDISESRVEFFGICPECRERR